MTTAKTRTQEIAAAADSVVSFAKAWARRGSSAASGAERIVSVRLTRGGQLACRSWLKGPACISCAPLLWIRPYRAVAGARWAKSRNAALRCLDSFGGLGGGAGAGAFG